MRSHAARLLLIGCLALSPASAWAQGHMLPGAGPINTAMGGAGVALPIESLGALTFNPALIAIVPGNQISIATEFYKEDITVASTKGTASGTSTANSEIGVVPAFGWMLRNPKGNMAMGFGLVGISSFSVDMATSTTNPVFKAWPNGFGNFFSDYREIKIPAAIAFQVSPKLAIGVSMNVYLASFAANPLPANYVDVSPWTGAKYYPSAGRLTNSFGFAPQFGFHYQSSPKVSIGGSLTLPQKFQTYTWNSTYSDPTDVNFGQARTLEFNLDGPMIATFGVGLTPSPKTKLAVDAQFTKYEGVVGFGGPGGISSGGVIDPFGWQNVWTIKMGLQHEVNEKMTVRAGYNYSQSPVRSDVVVSSLLAPLTYTQHLSAGVGMKMFPFLEMNASLRYTPRGNVAGPYLNSSGVSQGTIDASNSVVSALIGMNFRF